MSIPRQRAQEAKALGLKKKLSQNFLIHERSLKAIADAAIDPNTACPMVEIGAGAGFLTDYLLESHHPLTAIEVDPTMISVLQRRYENNPQFHLRPGDVLKQDLTTLLIPKGIVVGNLPYHLTGPILFYLIGELNQRDYPLRKHLTKMLLMVQKEVGERLAAKPKDAAYSQLSIQAQFWFHVDVILDVPKSAFYPAPKVDSVVVKLTPRDQPLIEIDDLSQLNRVVKMAFLHRRKTLWNNLKHQSLVPEAILKACFETLQIPMHQRPQETPIQQFGALSHAFLAHHAQSPRQD